MQDIATDKRFAERVEEIYSAEMRSVYTGTDKLFLGLLLCEWVACIFIALILAPLTWNGSHAEVHIHLIAAIFLGGMIVVGPVYFIYKLPGQAITRHVIAVSQMLFSSLSIHLTGGRIETHFHIFGSLAFLATYRDWKVLVTASTVVILDHILRGIFMPQSIYGVDIIEPTRWLEHAWYVVFEDAFLIKACLNSVAATKKIAARQAETELTKDRVEETVRVRTSELLTSERRLTTQYAVSKILAESESLADAFPKILLTISKNIFEGSLCSRTVCGEIWQVNSDNQLLCQTNIKIIDSRNIVHLLVKTQPSDLVQDVFTNKKSGQAFYSLEATSESDETNDPSQDCELSFPVIADGQIKAVVSFRNPTEIHLSEDELSMFEALGQQMGQFMLRREVETQNLRLASLVQSSSEAIVGQDRNGKITTWNRGAEKLFGYTADQAISQSIGMLLPESMRTAEANYLDFVENLETVRLTKDGDEKDVEVSNSPIYDHDDQIIGVSSIFRDITERRESEKRVSEFYSIVSHELRSPLTSIRGALGLIEGGVIETDSAEAMDLIVVARESSDRLIRLINDILDLKKIEAGKFELANEEIFPDNLIRIAVDNLKGMAEQAAIEIDQNIVDNTAFVGDKDRCTQVIVNLVSNAIKFSPPGSRISISAQLSSANRVRFAISDNGPGIPEEQMHKLFDKFQQLDSSDTRAKGGTGLGLAITKAIVEEHGGEIGVESVMGSGTTFWIELPTSQSFEPEKDSHDSPPMPDVVMSSDSESCTVLIVEDDDQLSQVLSVHVGAEGFSVVKARTLRDARKYMAASRPDVIILDLKLPDGDGLSLIEEMRDNPNTSNIPVVVITGKETAEGYSCNPMIFDWLQKPFDTQTLIQAIERSIALPNKRKVLIIGSDENVRNDLSTHVFKMGLECVQANNYDDAIALANDWSPNLVLIDFDILSASLVANLRQTPTKRMPLIVFSSKHQNEQSLTDLSIGIAKYLTTDQEFSLTDFERVVHELIGDVKSKKFDLRRLESLMNSS
ncbi:MAG TPA: ATP-binding protein [Drouetiella sp.]